MGVVCLRTRYSLLVKKHSCKLMQECASTFHPDTIVKRSHTRCYNGPFFKMIGCIVGSGNKLRVQQSATGGTSAPLSWYFLHYPMCLKSCCAPHMLFFFLFFFTPTDLLPSSLMFHKRWAEIKSLFESAPISLPPTYPFCANFSHSHHSVAVWRAGGKR